MDLILYAVPLFLIALLCELGYGLVRDRNTYRFADTLNSLSMGTLSRLRGFLFLGIGGAAWQAAAQATGVTPWPTANWWTWVVAFIVYDLCYYWAHRLGHEVNLLWASHVAHHQSEEYNLSTALRQTSTGVLTFVFYLPMFLVGVPAEVVVTVGSLNLIYQFWVHTRHVPRLGFMEWVFVTPSNHRVHHAQNDRYLDRNYGGVFILWDRLFGTWQEELDDDEPIYGIRHALHSFNPLWANLHVYRDCALDSWRTRHWRDKLGVWLRGPAWRPDDLARTDPRPEFDPASFARYEPVISRGMRRHVLFQFLLAVALALPLMVLGASLPSWVATMLAILLISGFVVQGMWLEGRPRALGTEYLRLASWALATLWLIADGFIMLPLGAGIMALLAVSAISARLAISATTGSNIDLASSPGAVS